MHLNQNLRENENQREANNLFFFCKLRLKKTSTISDEGLSFYSYCSKYAMMASDDMASLFVINTSINVS